MLKEQLLALGFSEKEADVFILLNRLGPTAASTLARLGNLNRTSIYDILNSLEKRNLVVSLKHGENTFYTIDDITKLKHMEQERLDIAKSVVETLEKQHHGGVMQVQHYRGMSGLRLVYEEILDSDTEEFLVWVNLDNFYVTMNPEYDELWTAERVKKKISARLMMADSPSAKDFKKKDKKNLRETLLLPPEIALESSCFLYKNTVVFFDTKDTITVVRIKHPGIYHLQKSIFESHWKQYHK